jgi:hypothetical protein
MAAQMKVPQSGRRENASLTRRAASSADGGCGWDAGIGGFLASWAGLTPIQPHRTAAASAPLKIQ